MEDAYCSIIPYDGLTAGFFGVYDGHAGKSCAEYAGKSVSVFVKEFVESGLAPPEAFHKGFVKV
jgi:serine/threonine protein phosphatase PrpC